MDSVELLALALVPGVGRSVLNSLVSSARHGAETKGLYDLLKEMAAARTGLLCPTEVQYELLCRRAARMLADSRNAGICVVSRLDPEFPSLLDGIPDPPFVLYIKGDIAALRAPAVAVVGTREPTEYGVRMGKNIAGILAVRGLTVVSGLAIGCDTAGHRGCLDAGGRTVAVLAHGLDMVYPKQNAALAARILESGGCLVSEYPIGASPRGRFFVERDRLQSGLSAGTAVVETDVHGGTMHTVDYALRQGRLLGCVVHPEEFRSDKSRGNELLVKERGAAPLGNESQVAEFAERAELSWKSMGESAATSSVNQADRQPVLFCERVERGET